MLQFWYKLFPSNKVRKKFGFILDIKAITNFLYKILVVNSKNNVQFNVGYFCWHTLCPAPAHITLALQLCACCDWARPTFWKSRLNANTNSAMWRRRRMLRKWCPDLYASFCLCLFRADGWELALTEQNQLVMLDWFWLAKLNQDNWYWLRHDGVS